MTWKPYIQRLKSKLSSFTYALHQLKRVTDFKTALTAYYAYAHSRLSYGVVIWGNCCEVDDVFILQKKCVRILANIDQMVSCRPYFVKYQLLTLTSIYIMEICKFVRKHNDLYSILENKHKRNNRDQNKLIKPFTKLELVSSSPHHMAIKIYNHIPNSLKNIKKDSLFIKKLKMFLIENCYYDIKEFFNDKC